MRLIIIGCEYTGKTTLTQGIRNWLEQNMGSCTSSFHDHFLPWDPEEAGPKAGRVDADMKILTLNDPGMLERYLRYVIHYHTHPTFYAGPDHCLVNWYYGDAVYAPLYYGYGGSGNYPATVDRQVMARKYDSMVMQTAPDTTLVLLKASADVIRRRRQDDAAPKPYPKEQDIELVLERFDEEYSRSLIRRRMTIDTSESTPTESLEDFVKKIQTHLTSSDQLRMLTHAAK